MIYIEMRHFRKLDLIIKPIFLLIILLVLPSCKPACVDADDFGFPKFSVSSRPSLDNKGNINNIYGINENQVMKWMDTGYVTNGDKLSIMVRNGNNSRWSFLYGGAQDLINIPQVLQSAPVCLPGAITDKEPWASPNPFATYLTLSNGPGLYYDPDHQGSCYFNKGVGLYGLITSQDPNASEIVLRSLTSDANTFHLGDNPNLFIDVNSGNSVPTSDSDSEYSGAGGYNQTPNSPIGSSLFFKILDHYYNDNGGQYNVIIKSGVELRGLRPIAKIVSTVETAFQNASESIYRNIVSQTNYQNKVKLLLTLYIIIQAICFIFGITQASQAQFIIHIFKIVIIMQLIATDTSWNFFSNTVFNFFTKGVNTMMCIVTSQNSACTVSTAFNVFDDALLIFFAPETWNKAFSLFFVQIEGVLLISLLVVCGVMFTLALIKAVILFLMSYLATSLLVVLSPIFIPFMLFKMTSSLFDNLISQFFNYFIQPIIVMASLSLWSNIVVTQLQKLLGFKVCVQPVLSGLFDIWKPMGVHITPKEDLNWIYAPGTFDGPLVQSKICLAAGFDSDCTNADLLKTDSNNSNFYSDQFNQSGTLLKYQETSNCGSDTECLVTCSDYNCLDLRFPDLPFLQPYIQADWDRIKQIGAQNYVTFTDILLFSLIIYLMHLFNNMIPELSRGISGGGGFGADINTAASKAAHSLKDNIVDNRWAKKHVWDNVDGLKDLIGEKLKPGLARINRIRRGITTYGSPGKLVKNIPFVKKQLDIIDQNRDEKSFNSFGGKYESAKNLAKVMKGQTLYNSSYGILGEDYKSKSHVDKFGRTRFDRAIDEYAVYHKGIDSKELKNSIDDSSKSFKSVDNLTKLAIMASVANPFVGGMIGMIGAYKAGKALTNRKNLNPPDKPENNNENEGE